MFAAIASALVLVLAVAIVRWIAAVPLIRTLSASMDSLADNTQKR
jgi:flagellar biosynthesis/type III secretory pathway M-ring protein FliF/YscJ